MTREQLSVTAELIQTAAHLAAIEGLLAEEVACSEDWNCYSTVRFCLTEHRKSLRRGLSAELLADLKAKATVQ